MISNQDYATQHPFQIENQSKSGFLVFSFIMMLLLTIEVLLPILPNDFWPYLRIGEEIVKTHSIPTTEFMTFTQFGQPVTYLYWLASLIFFGSYQQGGVLLVSILCATCIVSFYGLLWKCLNELKIVPVISGFVILITAAVGINYWSTRPQILVYPLFGLLLLLIVRWQNKNDRLIWLIPILAMLWANLHGSFIVSFLLLIPAILFGSGNKKKLLLITIFSFLTTFINPYWYQLWIMMFSMVNNQSIRLFSLEWKSLQNIGWQANIFFATLLLIPVLAIIGKQKTHLLYWVWFVGFGWMALSSERYGPWFLGIETFLLALLIQPIFSRYFHPKKRFQNGTVNLIVGIILLALPIALLPGVRGLWWQQAPSIYNERTPTNAIEWLKKNPQLPGEMWSDYSYSTYMTYALPERKLFMTNRFEDFPPEQFVDNKHIAEADYDWQIVADKYGINLIVASIKGEPELIRAISKTNNWTEVYRDDQTVVFEHNK